MPALDRTDMADRLELLGAGAEFMVANAQLEDARRRVVRLARRIVQDATLSDAEAVARARNLALETLREVTRG